MAFIEGNQHGLTNSTTRVVAVAAPAASVRRLVRTITVYNADTVAATVILEFSDPAGATDRVFARQTLATLETFIFNDVLVLDETDQTISLSLAAAITTNQLQFTSHFSDVS